MTQKRALPPKEEIIHSDGEPEIKPSPQATPTKLRRGFAVMSPEQHRAIASQGGKAAHALGHAHRFTSQEARAAGRKGGQAVSQDRTHMAVMGRGAVRRQRAQSIPEELPPSNAIGSPILAPSEVQP